MNSTLKIAALLVIFCSLPPAPALSQVAGTELNTGFSSEAQAEVDRLQQQYKSRPTYSGWDDFNRMARQQRWSPEKYRIMSELAKQSGVLDSADDPLNGPGAKRDNGLPVYKDEGRPQFGPPQGQRPAPPLVPGWTSDLGGAEPVPAMQQAQVPGNQPAAAGSPQIKPGSPDGAFYAPSLYQKGFFDGITPEAMNHDIKLQRKEDLSKSPDWAKDQIKKRHFQDGQEHFGEEDPNGFF